MMSEFRIGVDTGGTFTDLVALRPDGSVQTRKALSTPHAPQEAVLEGLRGLAADNGLSLGELLARTSRLAHGTTVSTNALIQRRGARVGLLMTAGFEDTLSIGRGPLRRTGGLPASKGRDYIHTQPVSPLVRPEDVRGIRERVGSDAVVLREVVEEDVVEAVTDLVAGGCESLAVCLLWSFRNPVNERRVGQIVARVAPDLPVSLSVDVAPLIGEYERCVTTVANAYLGPTTETYIRELEAQLEAEGLGSDLQIMRSSGGLTPVSLIKDDAVAIVNSGPTGGLVASQYLGELIGADMILTTDMGGTSFDVGMVEDGAFTREQSPFIDQGLPVRVPAARMITIGAGGGSIAWSDRGRLGVGPSSAGSQPGPACYGRGGVEPTVTDALLILGLLSPERFFGGQLHLSEERAREAVATRVAEPLGMGVEEAAAGIYEVVTAQMSDLMRKVTVERGLDPRDFVVFAYGGASPLHAGHWLRMLDVREVVVPATSAVFSALGVATSMLSFSEQVSEPVEFAAGSPTADVIGQIFDRLWGRALERLARIGVADDAVGSTGHVELRYRGQMNELSIECPAGKVTLDELDGVKRRFEQEYERRFGRGTTVRAPMEAITFTLDVFVDERKPRLGDVRTGGRDEGRPLSPVAVRRTYQRDSGWWDTNIYEFAGLVAGDRIEGRALVERGDTSILVPEGTHAVLDEFGNVRIRLDGVEQEVSR
jgi:N-methylhydantoinase A